MSSGYSLERQIRCLKSGSTCTKQNYKLKRPDTLCSNTVFSWWAFAVLRNDSFAFFYSEPHWPREE